MAKTKLEILEIYDCEIVDMNRSKKINKQKSKRKLLFEIIKNCFVSAFPKVEWLYIECLTIWQAPLLTFGAVST